MIRGHSPGYLLAQERTIVRAKIVRPVKVKDHSRTRSLTSELIVAFRGHVYLDEDIAAGLVTKTVQVGG